MPISPTVQGSTQAKPGSSLLIQPAIAGGKVTISTRVMLAFKKLQINPSDVDDPTKLLSLLQRFQENVSTFARPIAQNPIASSLNVLQGVVFTGGQTLNLQHGLGHAYMGWWCVRARGNPAVLVEAALPVAATAAQVLPITSTNAGTYDIAVF